MSCFLKEQGDREIVGCQFNSGAIEIYFYPKLKDSQMIRLLRELNPECETLVNNISIGALKSFHIEKH